MEWFWMVLAPFVSLEIIFRRSEINCEIIIFKQLSWANINNERQHNDNADDGGETTKSEIQTINKIHFILNMFQDMFSMQWVSSQNLNWKEAKKKRKKHLNKTNCLLS